MPTEATPLVLRADGNVAESDDDSTDATGTFNLNMCSAWTHVCADTLRSIAVLCAAALASAHVPGRLTAGQADSDAAIVVSGIILISLVPLIQGLILTARKIYGIWFGHDRHHHDHDVSKLDV